MDAPTHRALDPLLLIASLIIGAIGVVQWGAAISQIERLQSYVLWLISSLFFVGWVFVAVYNDWAEYIHEQRFED